MSAGYVQTPDGVYRADGELTPYETLIIAVREYGQSCAEMGAALTAGPPADVPAVLARQDQAYRRVIALVAAAVPRSSERRCWCTTAIPAALRGTPPGTTGTCGVCGACYTSDPAPAPAHENEDDVPGYCTCGELTTKCPARPRPWRRR